ncbi:MAG: TolC family protein [Elusimicrobia bacterium]|nr:TolC family protein [Elusimicrobiota bacterium]MDE2237826.1 TolC family protein [Elusimicrobiota bacterium]MDE2425303.1 TolC family protein [Elusimicrobiota bacterium]
MRRPARTAALGLALASLLAAPAAAAPLSMAEAMRLAVQRNLTAKLARSEDEAARARTLEAASQLLPMVAGSLSQQRVFRVNLAAEGLSGGGFATMLGPFDVFDARFRLAMSVLDLHSWLRLSAARRSARAAALQEDLAGEQVAGAAALAYIEALRAREAIRSAQAGVDLASELLALARERLTAGTAMGLDVARARTREAEESLRLLDARTAATDADLRLKRIAGLPLGEPLELTDMLVVSSTAVPPLDATLADAQSGRLELRISQDRLQAAGLLVKAARADRLPRLLATADAGLSGNQPDSGARTTGSIGAALSLPLFDGGLAARTSEARAADQEARSRYDDLLLAVEEDARRAEDRLSEAAQRVGATRLASQLAREELKLARGRFAAGVGDNLELVNAQTELARADDQLAAALAQFETARVNRALAVGRMRDFKFQETP